MTITTAIHPGIEAPSRIPDHPEREQHHEQPDELNREVEEDRQDARPERGEPQLEHDRFGSDDAGAR